MVTLISLPNELLLQIFRTIFPADLENFAQTCKHTYQTAKGILEEHRALIKTYSTFTNVRAPNNTYALLLKIIDSPRLAHYVRHVTFGNINIDGFRLPNASQVKCIGEAAFGLGWLEYRGPFAHPGNVDICSNAWAANSFASSSMLLLLPNLTRFSMSEQSCLSTDIHLRLSISDKATSGTSSLFHNLELVDLVGSSSSLIFVHTLCLLPFMRKISARSMHHFPLFDNVVAYPNRHSNVSELSLMDCRVNCKALHEFLRGFTSLKSFEYSFDYSSADESLYLETYEPFFIRSALLQAKFTLRSLVLLAPRFEFPPFFGPLREFAVLELVHTDWTTLLPTISGNLFFMQLSSYLPSTLRILSLEGRPPWGDGFGWDALLDSFLIAASDAKTTHKVPHWEQLIFSSCPSCWRGNLFGYGKGFERATRSNLRVIFLPCGSR